MTVEQAIAEGPAAVEKLIQAETDRRVNQAREKWESELPERVDAEIHNRAEKEKQQAAKRVEISEEIQAQFGDAIDADTWGAFVDVDGFMSLEGDEKTAAITAEVQRVQTALDRVLKRKFSGGKPQGTDEHAEQSTGADAHAVARIALGI